MPQLTSEQVDLILDNITNGGVTNQGLQGDLLDHYCCFIEQELDRGTDFDTAYKTAFVAITPNGMHEIQEELFFLLTFKKQTTVKRILFGSGFLAAFFTSIGFLAQVLHWPGAVQLLFTGFSALIVSAAVILINAIKNSKVHSKAENFRIVIGVIVAVLLSLSNLFKLFYRHGANIMLVLGMGLFILIFLPMFFYRLYKQSLSKT